MILLDPHDTHNVSRRASAMSSQNQVNESCLNLEPPMAMVSAGSLTSTIWKLGSEASGWKYRFNLFRQLASQGSVTQSFRPADLLYFVKLTQVLAAVIADDGCLSHRDRMVLQRIAGDLDKVLRRHDWNEHELPSSSESQVGQTPTGRG